MMRILPGAFTRQGHRTSLIRWSAFGLLWTASALGLSGCATTQRYSDMVNSWQGQRAEALVNTWGYPDRMITAPDGNPVYVYTHTSVYQTPAYTTGNFTHVTTENGQTTIMQSPAYIGGGQTYYQHCTTWFEINKDKRIVHVSFRGNDCRA
jgi:hypothetical protein